MADFVPNEYSNEEIFDIPKNYRYSYAKKNFFNKNLHEHFPSFSSEFSIGGDQEKIPYAIYMN